MTDQPEPSVFDYFLAKIQFWKKSDHSFSEYFEEEMILPDEQDSPLDDLIASSEILTGLTEDLQRETTFGDDGDHFQNDYVKTVERDQPEKHQQILKPSEIHHVKKFPWRILVAIVLGITAQSLIETSKENANYTIAFYVLAAAFILWSYFSREFSLAAGDPENMDSLPLQFREIPLLISIPLMIGAFVSFGSHRFTQVNLLLWAASIGLLVAALWLPGKKTDARKRVQQFREMISSPRHLIRISKWEILMILVALLAVFFRTNLLNTVPGEMFSDQAEKLLDVQDVIEGQWSTFFPRNTGREAFQMYLTAAVVKVFGTGYSFLSLKIGTSICGLLMLPYIYLLGKEIGNKWVGFFAVVLASIAYWPNVISRVGLRYILYAAFTAPTLFYFIRGMRRKQRNDFILSGIFLGLGLHGYSSFRFIPIVIVVGAGLYWLHHLKTPALRKNALWALLIITLISFVIFIPLFRYWISYPEMFSYRMATRLGTLETDYPGNPVIIFFENFIKASLMFFNDNGNVWVHSIPGRPALDVISAVFYFFGILLLLIRYFQKRNWVDLFLLLSIPLLLMPSILSLAFPAENPCLNRTSGAMVPVFIAAGMGMEALMRGIKQRLAGAGTSLFAVILTLGLLSWSAYSNYDLVFHQYQESFMRGAWNTSDMGAVIRGFADSIGTPDSAFVVPYPYWVDTRLVGMNAGYPRKDFAVWPADLHLTLEIPSPKMFILNPQDTDGLDALFDLYPDGKLKFYDSQYEGKDFYIFLTTAY